MVNKTETKTKLKDFLKKVKNIKNLVYHLKCTICHDILVEATVTNCGHSYCKSCIETWKKEESQLLDHGRQKLAKCPNCNTEIQTLSTNHMLKTHIEEMCNMLLSEEEKSVRQETIQENIKAEELTALKRAASAHAVSAPIIITPTTIVSSTFAPITITPARHVGRWEARGASWYVPPVFGRSVNPISTRGVATLCPPHYCIPLWIFRICDGSEM